MTSRKTKAPLIASLIAATGLASLSPVQQAAVGVAAVSALGMASPAWATNTVPGVGTVIKHDCSYEVRRRHGGKCPSIAVPSDANGNTVLTGLEPGEYEVKLIGAEQAITVPVGRDGRLAVTAWEERGRQWVAPLRMNAAGTGPWCPPGIICEWSKASLNTAIDVRRTFSVTPPTPCARPRPGMPSTCRGATMNYIDVNTSSAEDIVRLAPATSLEAARFLVEERQKGGKFKAGADLAGRICPKVSIDFGLTPTIIGETRIIPRAADPRAPGWKCGPGEPVIELFGKKHNYVGHVTLLR